MSEINGIKKTPMAVTENHRALVQATTSQSVIDQVLAGWGFEINVASVTPTGANDFMAFKNLSPQLAVMTLLGLTDAGAETLTGSIAANYDIAGTNSTPDTAFNRSGGYNTLSDKMQVAQGVTLTGTGAVLSVPLTIALGAGTVYPNLLNDASDIIIPPGHCFTLGVSAGTDAITVLKAHVHFIAEPFIDG